MKPIIVLALLGGSAWAQGTRADYDRAAALPAAVRDKVAGTDLRPRWSEDGARMIYTVGRETWLVDAEKGTRERTTETKDFSPSSAPAQPRREGGTSETSPDGKWSIVLKDYNLRLRQKSGGEEIALTSDGTADHAYSSRVVWSPDSSKFVSLRTKTA